MDFSDVKKLLIEELSSLGVSALGRFVDERLVERLSKGGISIDSSLLANLLVSEKGLDVLRIRDIRLMLIQKFEIEQINDRIGSRFTSRSELSQLIEFGWGDNTETRRFLSLIGVKDISLDKSVPSKDVETVRIDKPLYPYQNFIRKSLLRFLFGSKKRKTLVHMPTGSGKTRTSLEAVCNYLLASQSSDFVVVWLAHSEELCEQAAESILNIWKRVGVEDGALVRLWGGSKSQLHEISGPTFVVSSFQTAFNMVRAENDESFSLFTLIRRKCMILVVDEAHQAVAPTYKVAIDLFSNSRSKIIGLTATPGRHHVNEDPEETIRLSEYFEYNKIDIVDNSGAKLDDPISFLTSEEILSSVKRYQIRSPKNVVLTEAEILHIKNQLDIPRSVLARLGEDSARTTLIATSILKTAVEMSRQTIVFAPSKECAIELAIMCTLRGCPSEAVTADSDKSHRRSAITRFKAGELKVLVNFGVLTTGFDAPNIEAVIVARPTTSVVLYSQMIGRGLRGPKMGGTKECLLVDVIDNIENMPNASQAFTYFDGYFK